MTDNMLVLTGNLTADPELRYTQAGIPVVNFTVAHTPRTFDRASNEWKDGEALFLRCSAWRDLGENAAHTLTKGSRVTVTGPLKQRAYQTREGENRTSIEMECDEIAVSLRFVTAQITRSSSSPGQQAARQQADSWSTQSTGYGDADVPF